MIHSTMGHLNVGQFLLTTGHLSMCIPHNVTILRNQLDIFKTLVILVMTVRDKNRDNFTHNS